MGILLKKVTFFSAGLPVPVYFHKRPPKNFTTNSPNHSIARIHWVATSQNHPTPARSGSLWSAARSSQTAPFSEPY